MFDHGFEERRLAMLADQHLKEHPVYGQIIFSADEEHRLQWCRFRFSDDVQEYLNECGFRDHVMGLMDNCIEYRHMHNQPDSDHGVIDVLGTSMNIRWVDEATMEALCDQEFSYEP
jgi:hypothetical protein